jgi:hypothetical protein
LIVDSTDATIVTSNLTAGLTLALTEAPDTDINNTTNAHTTNDNNNYPTKTVSTSDLTAGLNLKLIFTLT